MKEPRITIPVTDAADLIDAYDSWKGSLPPEEWNDYMARFDKLRDRIDRLYWKYVEENDHE